MHCSRIALGLSATPLLIVLLGTLVAGRVAAQESSGTASDRDEIIHVLNRVTFGPRPGDVDAVEKMGLHNYLEQQLHPETIDDAAVDQEVSQFELLQLSPQQLSELYLSERKKALQKQKLLAAKAAGQDVTPTAVDAPPKIEPPLPVPGQATTNVAGLADLANRWRSIAAVGQLEQAKLVRAVDSQRQLQEVLVDFWGNHFNIDVKKGEDSIYKIADDRDVIRPHIWGKFRDLLDASAKSPAMLLYLDNASNTVAHTVTQREVMLTQVVADKMTQNGMGIIAPPVPKVGSKKGGINENYAREVMELHTLGVDGGYTQQDVQEVARCFTGWTINRLDGSFVFRPRQHDNGAKVVLGHNIPAGGGLQDGETVLDILCASPACAHHIALEMCQRFVSDDPPAGLVDRVAGVFTQSGGDLRAVTESILTSPEFLSPANFNNKIKSPLEFAVSAVRASDSTIVAKQAPPFDRIVPTAEGAAVIGRQQAADRIAKAKRQSLNWHIVELGEPLFACTPPTGYKEVSKFWVSPGALIERLNFAMALTQQEISDIRFSPQNIIGATDVDKPDAVLDQCASVLLQNNMTDSTRKVLEQVALPVPGESKTVDPSKLIALMIGSPEFQRK